MAKNISQSQQERNRAISDSLSKITGYFLRKFEPELAEELAQETIARTLVANEKSPIPDEKIYFRALAIARNVEVDYFRQTHVPQFRPQKYCPPPSMKNATRDENGTLHIPYDPFIERFQNPPSKQRATYISQILDENEEEQIFIEQKNIVDIVDTAEKMELIQYVMDNHFSKKEKEVFALYAEGYRYEDIAEEFNLHLDDVRSTIFRCKKRLRAVILDENDIPIGDRKEGNQR